MKKKGAYAPFFLFPFFLFGNSDLYANSYDSLESEYHYGDLSNILKLDSFQYNNQGKHQLLLAKSYLRISDLDRSENLLISVTKSFNREEKTKAYLFLIDIYVKRRELERCKEILEKVDSLIDKNPSEEILPYYHLMRGKVLSYYNEELSYKHLNQSLKTFPEDNSDIFNLYSWLIDSYLSESRLKEADKLLEKAINIYNHNFSKNEYLLIPIMLEKALFFQFSGDFLGAVKIYEKEVFSKLNSQNERFLRFYKCEYFRLASISYSSIGNYDKTLQLLHNYVKDISKLMSDSYFRLGEVCESISKHYSTLGRYELSILYLKKSVDIYKKIGRNRDVIRSLHLLSQFEANRDSFSTALTYLDKILTFGDGDHFIENLKSFSRFQKLNYLVSNSENDQFFAEYKIYNRIEKNRISSTPFLRVILYQNYLKALIQSGSTDKEILNFIEKINSEVLTTNLYKKEALISLYNAIVSYLIKIEDYNGANALLEKSLPIVKNIFVMEDYSQVYSLTSIGLRNYYLAGQLYLQKFLKTKNHVFIDSGLVSLKQGIEVYEKFNNSYSSQTDRVRNQRLGLDLINLYVSFLFESTDQSSESLADIFQQIQLCKSSQLLESLNRNIAIQQTNIPDTLILQVNSLKKQASYLNTQISKIERRRNISGADSSRLSNFKSVLLDNKVSYNDLMLYLERTFPRYYEINYNPKIATIQDVQKHLSINEAIIEYFFGRENIYAFVISKDTTNIYQLSKVSDRSISRFREVVIPQGIDQEMDVAYRKFVDQSHQLYQQLLAKPLQLLANRQSAITKLYIIPDKSLSYLAFDLLLSRQIEKDKFIGYGKLPYLIKDFNVSYGYSASILFKEDSLTTDVSFNGKVLAFAPSYEKLLADTSKVNQLGQFRNSLSPLKYNKSEVDGISGYFDTQVYKADAATEKQFVENFKGNDIIHLAMHGLVDSKDSEKSRLVFTPIEDSIHDNYLHNFELYNLNIDTKMAVLSACNTGYGKLEGGEGVMSLARAFTYAGSESVVMSQWPADDEATSVIMQSFYKHLSNGKRKDHALRLAKLDYLEQAIPQKRNPFYWNNFVLMGDVSPIIEKQSNTVFYLFGSLMFILAILAFQFRKKRN
ncbi:MAG: CHAT domain-containing protein [Bacteroidota bacterium]